MPRRVSGATKPNDVSRSGTTPGRRPGLPRRRLRSLQLRIIALQRRTRDCALNWDRTPYRQAETEMQMEALRGALIPLLANEGREL